MPDRPAPRQIPEAPMLARSLLFAMVAGFLPVPALASTVETRSLDVSYADLDLSNPDGAVKLDRRVKAAANAVCGRADARDLRLARSVAACRKDALARATPKVNEA